MHNRHEWHHFFEKMNTSTVNILIVLENKAFNFKAVVMPKLTDLLPTEQINIKSCIQINTVKLADPSFNTPKQVDIILGSDILEEIILDVKRQESNGLHLRNTVFRWTVSGQPPEKLERAQTAIVVLKTNIDLRSFWETAEIPMYKQLSPEEQIFEQHFTQTTTRDRDGRFVVKLCCDKAEKQLFSLERRVEKDPASKKQYRDFIKEFLDTKHLEEDPQKSFKDRKVKATIFHIKFEKIQPQQSYE